MIRPARSSDIKAIVELFEDTIGGHHEADQLSRWLLSSKMVILVDLDEDLLRGAVVGQMTDHEAEIFDLAVAVRFRRSGVAAQLTEAFIQRGRNRGIQSIFLEVRKNNAAAIALYSSRGFAHCGERPGYYPDGESAMVLQWSKPCS